ncbi:MAG: hypothetical protein PHH20_00135 [Candidatus Omnitrophica bacterium]|nr:hypothetical protein [Candidatus Omnitrophota bacterium]
MLTGINIYESKPYKSKLETDAGNPTIFNLGLLDSHLRAFIEDQTTSFEFSSKNPKDPAKANINASKRNLMVLKFGLKGLENFLDPRDKKPVKFDTVSVPVNGKNYNVVSDEIISMFPKVLIDELADVILSENTLGGDEAKN